jgi:hypothetical protein
VREFGLLAFVASWLAKYGSQISVLISVCAFVISAFSLGWNVYRDVILKARLKVAFSASQIELHQGLPPRPVLLLTITNLGPGNVICNMAMLQKRPPWMQLFGLTTQAVIIHDVTDPLCFKLPFKLDVAQTAQLTFPITADFLDQPLLRIGVRDSFGRINWAPRRDIRQARKDLSNFRLSGCEG